MTRRELFALTPILMLTGCSSEPAAKKEPEKPAEPVTGLTALFRCYQQARTWSQDLTVLKVTSIHIAEVKQEPGKAAAWQVEFISQATKKTKTYTFSVYDAGTTLRKGIYPEREADWTRGGRPFLIAAAKVDTDAIWTAALKKGEAYSSKNPDMPISYLLEMDNKTNNPAWRVIWGENASSSSFSVMIDASTGEFLEILH